MRAAADKWSLGGHRRVHSTLREGSLPQGEDALPSLQLKGGFVRPPTALSGRIKPGPALPDAPIIVKCASLAVLPTSDT